MDLESTLLQLYGLLLQFPLLTLYVHVFAIFTHVFSVEVHPFNGQGFPERYLTVTVIEETLPFLQEISMFFRKNSLISCCQKDLDLIGNWYHQWKA